MEVISKHYAVLDTGLERLWILVSSGCGGSWIQPPQDAEAGLYFSLPPTDLSPAQLQEQTYGLAQSIPRATPPYHAAGLGARGGRAQFLMLKGPPKIGRQQCPSLGSIWDLSGRLGGGLEAATQPTGTCTRKSFPGPSQGNEQSGEG